MKSREKINRFNEEETEIMRGDENFKKLLIFREKRRYCIHEKGTRYYKKYSENKKELLEIKSVTVEMKNLIG